MKLLQINITANWGSHGKIAEGIGNVVRRHGGESYLAYGRWMNESSSSLYRIGSMADEYFHGLVSRVFDCQGLMSQGATKRLISYIKQIQPDIIHLHNIHGYYLNYPLLFRFLAKFQVPIVWTLHDCWPFTGHCAHYMFVGCDKWKSHCLKCPQKGAYPKSLLLDRAFHNFDLKRQMFHLPQDMTLIPVSKWLEKEVKKSFLKDICIQQIYNGIDVNLFSPKYCSSIRAKYSIPRNAKIILGVASNWYHKGFEDFIQLQTILNDDYRIVLVGLNSQEMKRLLPGMTGITRTQDIEELKALYTEASVFFNPTWEDNFPTTNLEALACDTPVVTYDTGGSPEAIDAATGFVIQKGDIWSAWKAIQHICSSQSAYSSKCRNRVVELFDKEKQFEEYYNLYINLIKKKRPSV